MISEEIKKEYPFDKEYGILDDLVLEYQKRYKKYFFMVKTIEEKTLEHLGELYLVRVFQKSKFLFQGFMENVSSRNPAVLFLVLRAHIEITSALGYFFYKLRKFYKSELSLPEIRSILQILSLGSRDPEYRKEQTDIPESINVLTMIDISDRLLPEEIGGIEKSDKLLSKLYTDLCEACHPNALSLHFGVKSIEPDKWVFLENPSLGTQDQFYFLLENMILACHFFFELYDKCLILLQTKRTSFENEVSWH